MRAVFDTNIFISALVFKGGQAEKAILKIIQGNDTLLISKDIIDETLTVLSRKFDKDIEYISRTALFLSEIAETVRPEKRIHLLEDEPDNRILECAIVGKADYIVTGDKMMLNLSVLGKYKFSILSLSEYLKI